MIELTDVSKTFRTRSGTVEALRGIDLRVAACEFVAIVGRSGCGKSTLLRLIAGLIRPTGGRVLVDGTAVTGPRTDVAMMFQKPALLPWRSALENVLLPTEFAGKRRSEFKDRAHRLLSMVGLADFWNKLPHELSGGMQQRVALCRCLMVEPRVLLMDEPFSALDALTRTELAVELQRIHMENFATVVFVTHSIEEAVILADRIIAMSPRPGQIRKILDIGVPRPRTLGHDAHQDEVARASAELHELFKPGSPLNSLHAAIPQHAASLRTTRADSARVVSSIVWGASRRDSTVY